MTEKQLDLSDKTPTEATGGVSDPTRHPTTTPAGKTASSPSGGARNGMSDEMRGLTRALAAVGNENARLRERLAEYEQSPAPDAETCKALEDRIEAKRQQLSILRDRLERARSQYSALFHMQQQFTDRLAALSAEEDENQ